MPTAGADLGCETARFFKPASPPLMLFARFRVYLRLGVVYVSSKPYGARLAAFSKG